MDTDGHPPTDSTPFPYPPLRSHYLAILGVTVLCPVVQGQWRSTFSLSAHLLDYLSSTTDPRRVERRMTTLCFKTSTSVGTRVGDWNDYFISSGTLNWTPGSTIMLTVRVTRHKVSRPLFLPQDFVVVQRVPKEKLRLVFSRYRKRGLVSLYYLSNLYLSRWIPIN